MLAIKIQVETLGDSKRPNESVEYTRRSQFRGIRAVRHESSFYELYYIYFGLLLERAFLEQFHLWFRFQKTKSFLPAEDDDIEK